VSTTTCARIGIAKLGALTKQADIAALKIAINLHMSASLSLLIQHRNCQLV